MIYSPKEGNLHRRAKKTHPRSAINMPNLKRIQTTIFVFLVFSGSAGAQDADTDDENDGAPHAVTTQPMTAARLAELILAVDEDATATGSSWFFHTDGLETVIVYDTAADRMRILMPAGKTTDLEDGELLRLMQANFDSALDARYAIAHDTIWGAFIHPLSTLTDETFLVGLAQTANVVTSFGTSYSSGMFMYGSGDSAEIERNRLIEKLKNIET
jgi:hypothetical protein